jgi:hypothetical protein
MPEPNDFYTDQFQFQINPLGCCINFQLSNPLPPAMGMPPQMDRVATIRLSIEHLKALTFMLHRQVIAFEAHNQIAVGLPTEALRMMQIRQEDWQAFWQP